MRVVDIVTTANGNLRRSKLRSFLTMLAIAIGTFTLALSLGLGQGVRNYISSQLGEFNDVNLYQVTRQGANSFSTGFGNNEPKEYDPNKTTNSADFSQNFLKQSEIDALRNLDGVREVQLPYAGTFEYVTVDGTNKYQAPAEVRIIEVPVKIVAGKDISSNDQGKILLSRKYVSVAGVNNSQNAVGKQVTMMYKDSAGQPQQATFEIAGVFEPTLIDSMIKLSESDMRKVVEAQTPFGSPNFFYVYASRAPNLSSEEFKALLSANKFDGSSIADINNQLNAVVNGIQMALAAFSGIAILASIIGVVNTLFMAVLERTREIGLFRALGAKRKTIFGLFSVEAALLGFWGSISGLAAAFLAQSAFNNIAANTFLKGIEGIKLLNITIEQVFMIIFAIALITMLAGLLPALKASRLDPIEALRYE